MKKVVVIISIFLSACGGAVTEARTDTAAAYVDTSSTQSNIITNKFNISSIAGKYSYSREKVMGGYKISGYYDLTLNKDFSYKLFKTILDEYNDNKTSYESFEGRYSYDGFYTIDFVNGDFGESGGKINLTESNLNGNIDQITVTFSSGRGDAMYFNKIIENRKPIFTSETVMEPGEYTINASDEDKVYFYSKPDLNYIKKSYFNTVEKVNVKKFEGDFGYVEFINSEGQTSKGWVIAQRLRNNK